VVTSELFPTSHFQHVVIISIREQISILAYLKAGLEAGAKAEAEARQAAMQNTVFMVKK
jgi:hypothetical protein